MSGILFVAIFRENEVEHKLKKKKRRKERLLLSSLNSIGQSTFFTVHNLSSVPKIF